jgi:hypothetical protein
MGSISLKHALKTHPFLDLESVQGCLCEMILFCFRAVIIIIINCDIILQACSETLTGLYNHAVR